MVGVGFRLSLHSCRQAVDLRYGKRVDRARQHSTKDDVICRPAPQAGVRDVLGSSTPPLCVNSSHENTLMDHINWVISYGKQLLNSLSFSRNE